MTELETAMNLLIDVFDKYSIVKDTGERKKTLTKGTMKTLLDKELPGMVKNAKDKEEGDKLLKNLDENRDSEMDFKEFLECVAALTCMGDEKICQQA
ncbi:protein S100-P-like [Hyla sarda]|uniref:protein S100-P-like n=1 Tax=Hyla sarda TaxID=327740 RepID=UPI0024C34365|nr:protein S100-P-like [Hyla sarda]